MAQLDPELPLKPPPEPSRPSLAPAWVSLVTAWLGLCVLIGSILLPFLPGSVSPREEIEHLRPYSLADRFLPFLMFGITLTLFQGIVVIWQMRKEQRPLPDALISQRVQAYVGIGLALIATIIVYTWVAYRGPR